MKSIQYIAIALDKRGYQENILFMPSFFFFFINFLNYEKYFKVLWLVGSK